MEKKEMRQNMRQFLLSLTYEQYKARSLAIAKQLFQEPSIIEGKTIAVTMSNRPEVDTIAIIEELWRLGKRVAVPKCKPATKEMAFYEIDGFFQTERAYMDILEPRTDIAALVPKEDLDVIIVPGIVFDHRGYRIGYGGGYYDRYLQGFSGTLISLAFNEQITECVPNECYDLPVHTILTEEIRIDCKSNRKELSS
ncbi:5-formyltetrahydrofolate cyclo-ligase [Solibacillus sp. FSL H8-0538]|uniref:5-formyltetrahydrofolate cyclo-ligase n=1 Tax=Solibacillus sp. FSL H8-0538 TaxID=2921400 RepID=UPI0030FC83B2